MEILEAILICFVISGIIIFIACTIMNLWSSYQNSILFGQLKKYANKTSLIHFLPIKGDTNFDYTFRNCNNVRKIYLDDIGDCNGKF